MTGSDCLRKFGRYALMVSDRPVAVICGFRKQASTAKQQNAGYSQAPPLLPKSQPFFPCTVTIVPSMSGISKSAI